MARVAAPAVVVLGVFLSRALFLPRTLEDIDSVNFALALEDFDPIRHQPHPPGFPVFVAISKAVHWFEPEPVRALSLTSAAAQALLVVPLVSLFGALASRRELAWLAALLTLFNPLIWFNGARPLSDSVGLLFAVSAQSLLLVAASPAALAAGSFTAGLAVGARLQVAFLVLPLFVFRLVGSAGHRVRATLALIAGVVIWLVPLLALSGSPGAFMDAFVNTITEAGVREPLVVAPTVNRSAHAVFQAVISPWGSPALGVAMLAFAGLGFLTLWRNRRRSLALGLLAFAPYFFVHLLLQYVPDMRYSMGYLPCFAWLVAEGIVWLAEHARTATRPWLEWGTVSAITAASSALVLPALGEYRSTTSPPYAAMEKAVAETQAKGNPVIASHYMFQRYLKLVPEGLAVIEPKPRNELSQLVESWSSGTDAPVLFVADPERTDLEMVCPRDRKLVGRWEWGPDAMRFLSGTRPVRAELVRIESPSWYSGPGWMLSDEAGSLGELNALSERQMFLKWFGEPTFLLLSGVPLSSEARDYELILSLAGKSIDRVAMGEALLRGYLPELAAWERSLRRYEALTVETRRSGRPAGAPFLLQGFDYGSWREPGAVHGEGWFLPERDEERRPFRWVSARALSLLHVPEEGARLRIEGVAPLEYFGTGLRVEIAVQGAPRISTALDERGFAFDLALAPSGPPFLELRLTTNRSFVPDEIQRNGDRRRLALRIYRFELH